METGATPVLRKLVRVSHGWLRIVSAKACFDRGGGFNTNMRLRRQAALIPSNKARFAGCESN
jgi:hypothetical protein